MARVYCAGPLFNPPERDEMAAIAGALEAAGHSTFLPQRDGFELADVARRLTTQGADDDEATQVVHRSIFALDAYQLLSADAVVANLNGRVPDDGTVVEAALAWHAGKALVLYKNDERSAFAGQDNPMLVCLTDLHVVRQIGDVPAAVAEALASGATAGPDVVHDRGQRIAEFLETRPDDVALATFLRQLP